MGELKFIGKRVVNLIVMLLGVATLVFILTKMIPGDPVVANLSQRALNDPESEPGIALAGSTAFPCAPAHHPLR